MVSKHRTKPGCKYTDMCTEIFKDLKLYAVFYDWAVSNLCAENLQFYTEADKFKKIEDQNLLSQEANRIFQKYIKEQAYSQVNLDHITRRDITIAINNNSPTKNMFVDAQMLVMELIRYDLLVKFAESDIYRDFRANRGGKEIPKKNLVSRIAKMPCIFTSSISKLENCLVDPIAIQEFLEFTKEEFSDALLRFYLDVKKYQENPSLELANEIFEKYLSPSSTEEVDADPRIKKTDQTNNQ